jgi:hypothetical protein
MTSAFKNELTNRMFNSWINNSPEEYHPYDRERFYSFVKSLIDGGEELTEPILIKAIKTAKKWNNDIVEQFVEEKMDEYYLLKEFYDFIKSKN